MSAPRGTPPDIPQPESFSFDAEVLESAVAIIAKYPDGRQASAVIAVAGPCAAST